MSPVPRSLLLRWHRRSPLAAFGLTHGAFGPAARGALLGQRRLLILGPRDDWFTDAALQDLLGLSWPVTPRDQPHRQTSDGGRRRLPAGTFVSCRAKGNVPGAIQIPHSGPFSEGHAVTTLLITLRIVRAARDHGMARWRCHPS